MTKPNAAQLTIAAGAPMKALLRSAIDRAMLPSGDLVVAAPARGALTTELRQALDDAGLTAKLVTPMEGAGLLRGVIGGDWTSVDVSARAGRLANVTLPTALFSGRALIAITNLREHNPARPLIAIGLWARFAHPRQRLGALLSSEDRDGLVPEIALAVCPSLILVGGVWSGGDLLISSNDQIAAELAGRALGDLQAEPDTERPGPWEHPLIQRATELDLGARYPGAISLNYAWHGDNGDLAEAFAALVQRLGARFGVIPA